MAREVFRARGTGTNPVNAVRGSFATEQDKEKQLSVILSTNPADDANMPGHTWIRSVADIHTFREAMEEDGLTADDDFTPDFTASKVKAALRSGKVTVYSSYPIKNGVFVSPSRAEAQNYAGNGRVYSADVRLTDVAWIDGLQGQLAKYRK